MKSVANHRSSQFGRQVRSATAGGSVPTGPWTTLLTGVLKCGLAFGNVKKSFSSTTGQFKKKKKNLT